MLGRLSFNPPYWSSCSAEEIQIDIELLLSRFNLCLSLFYRTSTVRGRGIEAGALLSPHLVMTEDQWQCATSRLPDLKLLVAGHVVKLPCEGQRRQDTDHDFGCCSNGRRSLAVSA